MATSKKRTRQLGSRLILAGSCLIALSLVIFLYTFYPVIGAEVAYTVRSATPVKSVPPVDDQFGIVIPKLGANSRIIANVNPYDSAVYQQALTQGVAHAAGTVFPGAIGNVFLFSHSSVNFYEANRYNSIFYLLYKLEAGDEIKLYYKGDTFVYRVTEKTIVDPKNVSYLTKQTTKKIVTLMTCWPPGTTAKRLLVIAEIIQQK